jgi:putative sterol carrier protein
MAMRKLYIGACVAGADCTRANGAHTIGLIQRGTWTAEAAAMYQATGRRAVTLLASISIVAMHLWLIPARSAAEDDKPSLAVFMEKSDIRQNDSVRVRFQAGNPGTATITQATIVLLSPRVEWHCAGCPAEDKPISSIALGRINPKQSVDAEAWFRTRSDIEVGQFNLLFRLDTTDDVRPQRQSVVLAEKSVSIKLLGTDTLAGIPLALAGLVVPGLCFLLILSWFGVSWSVDLPLGDKILYSMLVSFFILLLEALFSSTDIFSGLSLQKLAIWAASGSVPGLLVGGFDKIRRACKASREMAIAIGPFDDDQTIFRKLLVRYTPKPNSKLLTVVTAKDRKSLYGSMAYQDAGRTVLVGWYKVTKAELKKKPELQKLADKRNWKKFYKGLLDHSVVLMETDKIQALERGVYAQVAEPGRWNNEDVAGIETMEAGWSADPLTIE